MQQRPVVFASVIAAALTFPGGAAATQFPIQIPTPGQVVEAVKKPVESVVKAGETVVKDVTTAVEKGINDVTNTGTKAVNDLANTVNKGVGDVAATTTKALDDTVQTGKKALSDVGQETGRALVNLVDAGAAVVRFTERQGKSKRDIFANAERRAREGKFVDAVWHLSTEQAQHTEENASRATQESSLVNTTAQVAASAYGGPGGAAAYAAWSTYKRTNDAELAIRTGVITGAAAAGLTAVGTLPSDQVAAKAVLAGAIGGTAVAAAGGSEEDVRDGFVKGAAMVIVQDGYERVTTHKFDARGSRGDAYCINTVGAECSPPDVAYERDASGKILRDQNGTPKVDIRKTDPTRPHLGLQSTKGDTGLMSEQGIPLTAVSRLPVMHAMSVFHDQWAMSWNMEGLVVQGTIVPAVVFTYIGTGDPLYSKIQQAAVKDARNNSRKAAPVAAASDASLLPTTLYQSVPYSSFVCTAGDNVRSIEVNRTASPSGTPVADKGALDASDALACEVVYQTETTKATPWKARRDANYCFEPALKLALKLDLLGWACIGR